MIDRVVAFMDDQAITLSEFEQEYTSALETTPDISREEVINSMVNRMLLLQEAKNYRIEAPTEDEVMKDYIDLKVRAFIRVNEKEIEDFYKENIRQFSGKDYEDVREEIEIYLNEKALNEMLKKELEELRKNAYIKIQLEPE